MSKLPNIIQRRELEPLLLKAGKIAKHYEKAANCAISVMSSDFNFICMHCSKKNKVCEKKTCDMLHMEAVNEARNLGGSYIYICPRGLVFWASPFYSGERFAGALISGGIRETGKTSARVKALANMSSICAEQISSLSFIQKNIAAQTEASRIEFNLQENDSKTENDTNYIDMERSILANLRRGDNAEAAKILRDLLNIYYQKTKDNLPAFRLKALELAILLSRATSDPNETNDRYLKKIEESSSFKEIMDTLSIVAEKMSAKIFSFHGVKHFPALRKAERYIWENYTRKLSLQEIADVSGLSAPYFSTIFKEEMGENLSNYLNRLRVEKAEAMLLNTNMPISEIASACGFEDQSWFSKIFKNNTGVTPGKYRENWSITGTTA